MLFLENFHFDYFDWISIAYMKMFDVSFLITFPANFTGLSAAEERRRKKKSRWGGSDNEKTFIPGMPTVLPSTMSADQQEAYLGKY